jgi:hypothetical protein
MDDRYALTHPVFCLQITIGLQQEAGWERPRQRQTPRKTSPRIDPPADRLPGIAWR